MFKKILLGIPLLCLSLQSTGYAAGTVVRELAEFGVPAARRAMSSFRQLAPLSTFQPPVPAHNLPAHTAKRYFSKVSDPVDLPSAISGRAFSAAPSPVDESTVSKGDFLSTSKNIVEEGHKIKSRTTKRLPSVRVNGEEFVRRYETAGVNCFPTLRNRFPQFSDCLDEIESTLYTFYVDCMKTVAGMGHIGIVRFRESFELWRAISLEINDEIEKETNLENQKKLKDSKEGVDWLFTDLEFTHQ
jgi:hypothetical protein